MNEDRQFSSEALFSEWATSQGWRSLKRGWPDYLCIKPDGAIVVVEVKGHSSESLSPYQETMMTLLADLGMVTFKWTPDTGLQPHRGKLNPKNSYYGTQGPPLRKVLSRRVMAEYRRFKEGVNHRPHSSQKAQEPA